jgi:Ca-activated chloride channel family protein
MRFAHPAYLHILWFVPGLLLFFIWAAHRRRRSLEQFGEAPLVAKLSRTVSRRRQWIKIVLFLLAFIFLSIAIARPQIGTHAVPVTAEGIDLVFALDTSLSMLAEDMKPNRLMRAKHEIAALMDKLRGDRVGIVIFSSMGFIQCPLTVDYAAAKLFLDAVDTNSVSVPGSAIADAISTSIKAFKHSSVKSSKVIILLTDGESHEGDPMMATEEAKKQGIRIYTIGIGSPKGEPIPIRNKQGDLVGYKKDKEGNIIMTKLDQLTLEKISILTDGQFYRASSSGLELEKIYGDISSMEKTSQETRLITHYEDFYQYFVGIGLLLKVRPICTTFAVGLLVCPIAARIANLRQEDRLLMGCM